jgi:hypothetical protein
MRHFVKKKKIKGEDKLGKWLFVAATYTKYATGQDCNAKSTIN